MPVFARSLACATASGLMAALALTPPAAAARQSFACPAQVRLNPATATLSPAAPGFTPLVSATPLGLTGASAFDGPPEQGAVLKPASEGQGAAGSTTAWRFEGSFEAGKWLSCDYAQGLVRLAVRLEAATTRCEARTTTARAPGGATVTLACD